MLRIMNQFKTQSRESSYIQTHMHTHTHTHKLSNANFLCKPFIKKKINKHLEIMWVFLKVDLWGIHGI